jgi:glycosyl transferase, family 25
MKIFVISLTRALDRREHITRRLSELGVAFEFFDAIDGGTSNHPVLARYDHALRLKKIGYGMRPGEIGVYASHYLLWQWCAENNTPCIVLEDDIEFSEDFSQVIAWLEQHIARLGFTRIGWVFDRPFRALENAVGARQLGKHLKGPRGGQGYAIHPSAAKKYLAQSERWSEPMDDYMDMEWRHGVLMLALYPAPVWPLDRFESTIGARPKQPMPLGWKLRREIYQSWVRLRSFVFNTMWQIRITRKKPTDA